jgi:hypothetical protein
MPYGMLLRTLAVMMSSAKNKFCADEKMGLLMVFKDEFVKINPQL